MDWFLYDNGLRLERVKKDLFVEKRKCINFTFFKIRD